MMAEPSQLQVTVRHVLEALFSEGAGDLHRRNSEGGHVIRINSRVLPRTAPGPCFWQRVAADAAGTKSESRHCPEDGDREPAKVDLQRDKFWVLCNVLCLGVAFMILSTSFIGTVDLQSSMNANQGLGTISLTSMYVISAVSNLCLPSFLIRWLGCKRTVAVCFLAYIPFITAQLDGTSYTLIPGAVLIGVALGPIYSAASTYLQLLARSVPRSRASLEAILVRLLSIFYVFVSLSQVWGSAITALVLAEDSVVQSPNASMVATLERYCGVNFCPGNIAAIRNDPYLARPSDERIHTVVKIYLACAIVAFLIVIFGVSSLDRYKDSKDSHVSGFVLLTSTVRLMKNRNQLLIIPITMWCGMHKAFIEEEFTQAYVSCAWKISNIGTVMICYGLATAAASMLVGFVGRATVRVLAVCLATVLQVSLLLVLLHWHRLTAYLYSYTVVAGLWAIIGGVWIIQLNSLCTRLFPGDEEAAFSNYRLWDAVGFVLVSSYSNFVCMRAKLYIQMTSVVVGAFFYLVMEVSWYRNKKKTTVKISG